MRAAVPLLVLLLAGSAFAATFCIPAPETPHMHVRYSLPGSNIFVDFECSGAYCCGDYNADTNGEVLITRFGEARPDVFPLYVQVLDVNGGSLTRATVDWGGTYSVTYVNGGSRTVRVVEEYPKSVAADASAFSGDLIFLETDPVLVVYVAPGAESPVTYRVHAEDPPYLIPYVELSACRLRVADVREERQGEGVLISFRVLERGRPAYLKGITVLIDGRSFSPQYDAETGEYTVFARLPPGSYRVVIRGTAPGCPAVVRAYTLSVHGGPSFPVLVLPLAAAAAALVALFRISRRKHSP